MSRKILDSIWFTSGTTTIGIVLTRNSIGKFKSYIGVGHGNHQTEDEQLIGNQIIANYGSTFPLDAAAKLFPIIEREKTDKAEGDGS